MSTLYLDRKGLALALDGERLVIREAGAAARSVPLRLIERVVLRAPATLDTAVLGALTEAGAGFVCLSGRHGRRLAQFTGSGHQDARRRLGQYRLGESAPARLAVARGWVSGKLAAQQRVLQLALAERPDCRHPLLTALRRLAELAPAIAAVDELARLRGCEGAAAAAYFPAFASLFAPALGFTGRNRRPPRDPVNAALSLGYTLLHADALRAAQLAGLDPLLGCLHEPAWGRESLACDLVEPLRPHVDAWVRMLFRERLLRAESFALDKGACLLGKEGRAGFYEAWERFAPAPRRWLRRQTHALVRRCLAHAPALASAPDGGED